MINPPAVLLAYLLDQELITEKVEDRLWEQRLFPLEGYTPLDGQAICFRVRGGQGFAWSYTGAFYHASWTFKAYGKDEAEADDLYWRLVSVLQDKQAAGIWSMSLETVGVVQQEPMPLGWYYNLSHFETVMLASYELA